MIAEVIIDVKNKQVNRCFDYIIPDYLKDIVKIGSRVKLSFGNSIRTGFVINIKNTTESKRELKEIIDVIDPKRVLNEEFIDIAKYIAENNFAYYASSLDAMIPTALKIKYQKVAKVINKDLLNDELKDIFKNRSELIVDNLPEDKRKIIYKNTSDNLILDTKISRNKNEKYDTMVHLNNEYDEPKTIKQRGLCNYLEEINSDIELDVLLSDSGYSKSIIDSLVNQGVISLYKKEREIVIEETNIKPRRVVLNESQKNAIKSIDLNKFSTYLLHGVTGSGKTEVYMKLIEDSLSNNRGAIMLVPEISLTPQITMLFRARFGNKIAILHSRLSISEKYNEWKKIINNDVKIVVGARSAIFAPINNLGIIIIDECHESSYRQTNNPKYDAKEIASLRAKHFNCPLVLGSATPDVCDYYYATNNEYKLLVLKERANGKKLNNATIVDMCNELKSGNNKVFSKKLQEEIIDTYNKHEQSILFLNRRGYSSFVMCRSCGESVKCPHCDASLTYHKRTNYLVCHYCGYKILNPSKCPSCGSDKIRFVGTGTEKILEEVNRILPDARALRVDLDTVSKMSDYEDAYEKFKNHEADILIGTQMITKGLDFDDVTLVGVLNADIALSYPSFDASMVAFNLIEQVSGRCGRANKDGKIIIQTYSPNNFVIQSAACHDYEKFYNYEIQRRQLQGLPPFSSMIELMIESKDASIAHTEAKKIVKRLNELKNESKILGPAEAPLFKKNDVFRFVITILAVEDSILDYVKALYPIYQNDKNITLNITRY